MRLTKKQFFAITLMLFAMFFGAGNFIFPPMLGKEAGFNVFITILCFCITAVILPILGVCAVARNDGLKHLSNRVSISFTTIFSFFVFLIIGPFFAIPRAGITPFEVAIAPFVKNHIFMVVYIIIYFGINAYICINPTRVIDTIGKFLTPIMLFLIILLFVSVLFSNYESTHNPSPIYLSNPAGSGFIQGYQTMDALGSLVFGTLVINAIKSLKVKEQRLIVTSTIRAGVLAGILLACVYGMLSYIGYKFSNIEASNGAEFLSHITFLIFGKFGTLLLGLIFLLACLTTTIGLITSASEYFASNFGLSYKIWVIISCVISGIIASVGLDKILSLSIPILELIYPVAINLIILALINPLIEGSKLIYRSCIFSSLFFSVIKVCDGYDINFGVITELCSKIPFYEISLGWVIPDIAIFCITYIIYMVMKKRDF